MWEAALSSMPEDAPSSLLHPTDRPPLSVHLYVTTRCNLRCLHCYNPYTAEERTLSPEGIGKFLGGLAERFALDVELEGGEFFLHPDAEGLLAAVPSGVLAGATVTTNGTVPLADGTLRLLQRVKVVRVSVEGHADGLHGVLRHHPLAPVLRTIDQLREAGVMPVLRTTLSRANAAFLDDMLGTWAARGLSRFSLFELQASGRGEALSPLLLNENDLAAVLDRLGASPPPTGVEEIKISLPRGRLGVVRSHTAALGERGYQTQILHPQASLTLDADGGLGVCPWSVSRDRETRRPLGHFDPAAPASAWGRISDAWREGHLIHHCDSCSAVRLLFRR